MTVIFKRIILYSNNVNKLKQFYQHHFQFSLIEEIENEWVVLKAGQMEIAFHKIGKAYQSDDKKPFKVESNVKLVYEIDVAIAAFRLKLLEADVLMREIKSYPNFNYSLCDGEDPEGNVFQLMQTINQ